MRYIAIKGVFVVFATLTAIACHTNVKVEPVEVKPITMTININIKVDRQLDEFFDFEQKLKIDTPDQDPGGEQ